MNYSMTKRFAGLLVDLGAEKLIVSSIRPCNPSILLLVVLFTLSSMSALPDGHSSLARAIMNELFTMVSPIDVCFKCRRPLTLVCDLYVGGCMVLRPLSSLHDMTSRVAKL